MRILVATDAWDPQVNGVVRTLKSVAQAAKSFGAEFFFLTPQELSNVPVADISGYSFGDSVTANNRATGRPRVSRCLSYRDGRPNRVDAAAILPQARYYLHHQLPHSLSRLYFRPHSVSAVLGLGVASVVSQPGYCHYGGNPRAFHRTSHARF